MSAHLVDNGELERAAVVANCNMNRERRLRGGNGYDAEIGLDPAEFLAKTAEREGTANWLDLCCGSGLALIEAAAEFSENQCPVEIVGVDLVDGFARRGSANLTFVAVSLSTWKPQARFDLITCVHGLHYIGDKLRLISSAASWLKPSGTFIANIDSASVVVRNAGSRAVTTAWRNAHIEYDSRKKRLRASALAATPLPFEYLGADPNAGPNYTGQPAVNAHYVARSDAPLVLEP